MQLDYVHVMLKRVVLTTTFWPTLQLDNVLLHNGFTAGQPAQVKLCDFGYSKSMGSNCITACGTPEYMAPEVQISDLDLGIRHSTPLLLRRTPRLCHWPSNLRRCVWLPTRWCACCWSVGLRFRSGLGGPLIHVAPQTAQVMSEKVYDGKKVDVWSCGCTLFVMLAGVFPFLKMSEEELAPSARLRKMWVLCERRTSSTWWCIYIDQFEEELAPSARLRKMWVLNGVSAWAKQGVEVEVNLDASIPLEGLAPSARLRKTWVLCDL
jgi:serine/threonine protein kinase